jgi:hypothetical protein
MLGDKPAITNLESLSGPKNQVLKQVFRRLKNRKYFPVVALLWHFGFYERL